MLQIFKYYTNNLSFLRLKHFGYIIACWRDSFHIAYIFVNMLYAIAFCPADLQNYTDI